MAAFKHFIFFCAGLLWAGSAAAFVVTENNPLSFVNVARDGGIIIRPADAPAPEIEVRRSDDKVDYQAIAAKLLPKRSDYMTINFTSSTYRSISIRLNFIVQVILPQKEGTAWRIDTDEKIVRPMNTTAKDGVRIFEFLSIRRGYAKIYLDNYNIADKRAVQSWFIKVRVY